MGRILLTTIDTKVVRPMLENIPTRQIRVGNANADQLKQHSTLKAVVRGLSSSTTTPIRYPQQRTDNRRNILQLTPTRPLFDVLRGQRCIWRWARDRFPPQLFCLANAGELSRAESAQFSYSSNIFVTFGAVPVKNYLKTLDWEVLPHPPYSPDTTPSDYHLFRSMAHALSEQRFTSYEDTKNLVEVADASPVHLPDGSCAGGEGKYEWVAPDVSGWCLKHWIYTREDTPSCTIDYRYGGCHGTDDELVSSSGSAVGPACSA
ncbi:Mariner Mos1 transposase [Eumeta japonica]|uniref:Mariner Mos1 transposase n=1 Tax=Eumeta variegata TaxID=151549 RepID=A0A4C1SSS9_EUMVA|nr:Mariner Mos1 transposase [Eumeta japonica]